MTHRTTRKPALAHTLTALLVASALVAPAASAVAAEPTKPGAQQGASNPCGPENPCGPMKKKKKKGGSDNPCAPGNPCAPKK